MFLTDFREYCLKDVITQLEPGLFKRVTGLDVKDFELLVSLGVFNGALMNDAVYKFKRYEDSSLTYTGIDKHESEAVGGFDTVLTREEFDRLFGSQQNSMSGIVQAIEDLPGSDYIYSDFSYDEYEDDETEEAPKKAPIIEMPPPVMAVAERAVPRQQDTQSKTGAVITPKPQQKEKLDLTEVKVGCTVKHKSFGDGVVVGLTSDKVTVAFGKAEKMFIFPTAFEQGFLSR